MSKLKINNLPFTFSVKNENGIEQSLYIIDNKLYFNSIDNLFKVEIQKDNKPFYKEDLKNIDFTVEVPTSIPVTPIQTPTTPVSSEVSDLILPQETMWNSFNPDLIPDFTVSKSYDTKTGKTLPNKWFIWHTPYRNLFGNTPQTLLTKMFNKGITAINASKLPTYYTGMESLVTFDRIVGDAGLGVGDSGEENYLAFEAWGKLGLNYAGSYHIPTSNGKTDMFLNIQDYEGIYSSLNSQLSANYNTIGLWSGVNSTNGRNAFQYGVGKSSGGYATSNLYSGVSNNVWTSAADNTVPTQYQGKSCATNSRIVGMTEIAYAFETFLPQGYQTKDQNGNNWIIINHFGNECTNTYGYSSVTNAEHWAAQLGSHVETMSDYHRALNQDFIIQLKPTNERDNGFHYSSIHPEWSDGKWIQEFNRYGITYLENDGSEQKNPIGSEYIPNFIAEAQIVLAYFCGAKGINWWSSDFTDVAIPKSKTDNLRRGAKHNDITYGNRDLENYVYTLKSLYRLSQKITLSDGRQFSFMDICDGSEIYLNQNTKVIYPGSSNITQLRALDWQLQKKTVVRAVLNSTKKCIFVTAFQPYGVEDSTIRFIYNENGVSIDSTFIVPVGKVIIKAFSI